MCRYWAYKNAWSMDGLPGMKRAIEAGKTYSVTPMKKIVGPLAPKNGTVHSDGFTLEQVMIIFIVAFVAGVMAATLSPNVLKNAIVAIRDQADARQAAWLPKSSR